MAKDGMQPLMCAAEWNANPEAISILLKDGAEVDYQTKDGVTSLMYAARFSSNPAVIIALLKAGANVKLRSNEGKTAFEYAEENVKLKGTDAYLELKKATF